MARDDNESVREAPARGDGRPVPPEGLAPEMTDVAIEPPAVVISDQPTAVAPVQPTAVAPAPAQGTGQTAPAAMPRQSMPKNKKTAITIAAIVAVVLVGLAIFRSVAASNASNEVHAALSSVTVTNDSFGTVNNVCGEYYVGYATEDDINGAQSALADITGDLDAAQKHLDNAASSKSFMSSADQAAFDSLQTSVSGRRAMVDAAAKIAGDSASVVGARGYLSTADTDFYEAEGELSDAIDSCNSLDFNSATTSANNALAKLGDATDNVNSAKKAYPGADCTEYDNYISKFTECANDVIKIKDAVDANDATTYSTLVNQFNSSFSELKSLHANRTGSYSLFADILEKNEKDNVRAYKDGLNTAEKAEEALSEYAGMDMTIQSAISSYRYSDSSSSSSSNSSTVQA